MRRLDPEPLATESTRPATVARPRLRALIVFCAFALSGCAGLIYQSIWTQYLGLFLGHAAYAQSLVLIIFMGGMALGAWWAGTRAQHWRNLLRAYALIELCIGLAAALFHPFYLVATQFAYDHAFPALAGDGFVTPFKWFLAGLLIFPQSVLLGATFPLMSNALMRRLPTGAGAILGSLYFTNSIGAAAGALFATFVLLPSVGLPGAMVAGALLNVLVSAIAFVLARDAEPAAVAVSPDRFAVAGQYRLLLPVAAFITGATSFVYEIGWVRMLSLAFGSTIHVFEIMLAAFISGLAFGAAWIRRRIDLYARPLRVGGTVQIAMGIAALISLVLYDYCFDAVAWATRVLPKSDHGYTLFNVGTAITTIAIMAPTAFFAGMTLPLFTLTLIRDGGGERSVGRIYSANTLGAIAGVLVAVHLLVPLTGLKVTMIVAACGDLTLGLVLLARTIPTVRSVAAPAAACVIAVVAAALLARFDPMSMAGGVYRNGKARFDRSYAEVVFYRDGKTASVSATKLSQGTLLIATNGKADASIQMAAKSPPTFDEVTAILAAALPLATHPHPTKAAVIGFGSGLTTHTLLGDSRLQQVDTIEIEPAMVEGAKVFGDHVQRAYDTRRSKIHFDDAKAFFAASLDRYDIIVSEPSNPWVSGVEGLFSSEFYRFVPRHLNPDGVFVQWLQMYEIDDELVAMIGRTLSESFADFRVYLANDSDVIVVATPHGSLGPLSSGIFRQPALLEELRRIRITGIDDLNLHQIGDRRSLTPLFDVLSQRSNSDFYPILSLEAPRARFIERKAVALLGVAASDLPLREVLGHIPPAAPGQVQSEDWYSPSVLAVQAPLLVAALGATGTGVTEPPATDSTIAKSVAPLRAVMSECRDESGDAEKIDVLQQLAGRTIPYLDVAHLQHVWIEPDWIECTRPTEAVRAMLDVIAALARRDFNGAGLDAVAMLQAHRHALSQAANDWLLRVAMLCAVAGGNYAEVSSLDSTLGAEINSFGWNRLQRAYLVKFAATQR